ncbi:hypothetical protein FRB97_001593, partial [Tulasnella sp. 331]
MAAIGFVVAEVSLISVADAREMTLGCGAETTDELRPAIGVDVMIIRVYEEEN